MTPKQPQPPPMSAAKFAADQLEKRFSRVFDALRKCCHGREQAVENSERVHQLRVACRRAAAAVAIFRPLLKRGGGSLKRWVQQIRRGAGPVRDDDVFLSLLRQCSLPEELKTSIEVDLKSRRRDQQQQLLRTIRRALRKQTKQRLHQKLCFRRSAHHQSIHDFSTIALTDLQEQLDMLLATAHPDFDELHRIRIAARRVRYGMEILSIEGTVPKKNNRQLIRIQELLGQLNDHVNAQRNFQALLASLPADASSVEVAKQVIAQHQSASALQKKFHRWLRSRRHKSR
jgi:CHAD domain-containing protein